MAPHSQSGDTQSTVNVMEMSKPSLLPSNASRSTQKDLASSDSDGGKDESSETKRFIPDHKKPDAALTFPEKLMNLMKMAQEEDPETFCVAWLPDGKSFVIRHPDEFTRKVLPKYFKATKFSSFTRKLYRWGFRQVNRGIGPDDPIIFGNEYFQRDNLELMVQMRSITAASTRKQEQSTVQVLAQKRALETLDSEQNQKRMLLNQLLSQKMVMNSNMFNGGNMNLAQALRPSNNGFNGLSRMDMFQQFNAPNPIVSPFQQNAFGGFNLNQSQHVFSNPSSTADIVNAAINALRFAP